jgi:ribonuclease Z
MKPTFHHRLINSRFEDPSLFVRMLRERRAFLFDSGRIDRLAAGDLLKITDVFVTHMHIDHFIGFDTLLRALLRRTAPLRVYGPEGIIECVEGKLRGYTWNLIEEYPVKIEVFGIGERRVQHSSFYADSSFARVDREDNRFDGTAMEEPPYTVRAVCLSHGIPCLGFSVEEDLHINIDKAGLPVMNLPVGPWLGDLKRLIREKASPQTRLRVGDREFAFSDLAHIATVSEGQKVSYITDLSPQEDNVARVVDFVRNSDTLYCEAYFLHEDRERALQRHHLTAKMAGAIAREANVKNLVLMHFSPKYRDEAGRLEEEAMREFTSQSSY